MADVAETVNVGAQVPADLVDRARAVAEADDRTLSYVVRQSLREYVERAERAAA